MPSPVTFTRLYLDHPGRPAFTGLEHPATPQVVATVIRSMREAAGGEVPFCVRFRLDDGTTTTVRPKRRAA